MLNLFITGLVSAFVGALMYRQWRWLRRFYRRFARKIRGSAVKTSLAFHAFRRGPTVRKRGYVRDSTIDFCVTEFVRRSRNWRFNANVSFYFSLASVLVGIGVFVFADRIAIDNQALQRLVDQRNLLDRNVKNQIMDMDVGEREYVISGELLRYWRTLQDPISRFASEQYSEKNDELKNILLVRVSLWQGKARSINTALSALYIIENARPISLLNEDDAQTFKELLESHQLDRLELAEFFARYLSLLKSYDDSINEQQVATAHSAHVIAKRLTDSAQKIVKALEERVKAAESGTKANATTGRFALRENQQQLNDLNESIAEFESKIDPNNLYSVIPLVVVRLGAVILLIFLTQILLAAYRYNTMLYTHYASIADALRIVPKREGADGPDYELLQKLVKTLHAQESAYTPPPSPISELVKLARPPKG